LFEILKSLKKGNKNTSIKIPAAISGLQIASIAALNMKYE